MGKDVGCCGQLVRLLFILINIFFVAIGIALLGVGIYLVVVGENYEFVTGNEYASTAPILIVCGAVSAIIAIIGVIGGLGLWWPVLMIYSIIVLIIIVMEIVAGVLGFVFQSDVARLYSESLDSAVTEFRSENATDAKTDVIRFINYVQQTFDCCGNDSPYNWIGTEYFNSTGNLPDTCECTNSSSDNCIMFDLTSQMVYNQGCNDSFFNFIENNAAIVGSVGIVFGLIELVGVIFGLILCCCVIKINREEKNSWNLAV